MAAAENNFKGKVETMPVIGKTYEHGGTFEKFTQNVRDYIFLEYVEGNDMILLLEK